MLTKLLVVLMWQQLITRVLSCAVMQRHDSRTTDTNTLSPAVRLYMLCL